MQTSRAEQQMNSPIHYMLVPPVLDRHVNPPRGAALRYLCPLPAGSLGRYVNQITVRITKYMTEMGTRQFRANRDMRCISVFALI
jgi:hypothetical protein